MTISFMPVLYPCNWIDTLYRPEEFFSSGAVQFVMMIGTEGHHQMVMHPLAHGSGSESPDMMSMAGGSTTYQAVFFPDFL